MIRIAVCDDEQEFHGVLSSAIEKYMEANDLEYEIDYYTSGRGLLNLMGEIEKYTIIFLDVSMEEIDGISLALKIRERGYNGFIVFVTAYLDYSIEGYKVNAIRYILKSSRNFELSMKECMDAIVNKMYRDRKNEFMTFRFMESEKSLRVNDIIYLESNLHMIIYYVNDGKYVKYHQKGKLNEKEKILREFGFVRIHQSFLVNMKHILDIKGNRVNLDTGAQLTIPRSKYRYVREIYAEYKGDIDV